MKHLSALGTMALLLLLSSVNLPTQAQVTTGEIFGSVSDLSGAMITGATVVTTDLSKGTKFTSSTNASGVYVVTGLIPDEYSLEVSAPGFRTAVFPHVVVSASASVRLNADLNPGQVTEKVEVTGATPLLKVDRADVSTSFSDRELTDLPAIDRNFTALELTAPGTVYVGWSHASSENPQRSAQVQVNGQNFWGTSYLLDGTDNQDRVLGIIVVNPNVDSIQEAAMVTSNFDAQYGNATGAVMSAQTKSGTNSIHGVAFDFLQNDKFAQARDPYSQVTRDPITHKFSLPLRYNQFGGNVGGPIIKDKVFFFGDYQGLRRRRTSAVVTFVPTAAERLGDFSNIATEVPIFDPTTGNIDGSGRTQFSYNSALNVLPPNMIVPQAQALLAALPLPNFDAFGLADRNFLFDGEEKFDSNAYTTREDWYLNPRMQLFGRYTLGQYDLDAPTAYGPDLGGPSLNGVNFGGISSSRNHSLATGFNYTFSPTLVTSFRFGFFRYHVTVNAHDNGRQLATKFGIPGINLGDPFTSGLPAININGFSGLVGGTALGASLYNAACNCPLRQNEWQVQFVNDWTKVSGKHEFKAGVDIRHLHDTRFSSGGVGKGFYGFANNATSDLNVPGSGLGLASFLLGDVGFFQRIATPFSQSVAASPTTLLDMPFSYVQDKWQATRNLIVSAGVRWDLYLPQRVNGPGKGGWFNFENGNAIVPGYGPYGLDGGVKATYRTFAPRLGIIWQMAPNTVLRLGGGRSYSSGNFGFLFGNAAAINYPTWVNQTITPTNVFQPIFSLGTAPPSALDLIPPVSSYEKTGEVAIPSTVTVYAYPRRQIVPTLDSWNASLQTQLATNTAFTISYVGNKGTNIDVGGGDLNVSPVIPPINNPLGLLYHAPYYLKNGRTAPVYAENSGISNNYHAMQVTLNQRYSGLQLQANYTWSKAMGYNNSWRYGLKYGYGPVGFDINQTFNLTHTYDLPFGKGRRYVGNGNRGVDSVLGGWALNGIWNWRTGLPTNAYYTGAGCLNCPFTVYPDRVADPYAGGGRKDHFWNEAAFKDVPASTVTGVQRQGRNASYDDLRGPHFWVANLSLFKAFALTERVNMQLRFEFYNAFNHVNWGMPSSYIDGPGFGKVTSTQQYEQDQNAMRSGQVGLKFNF